MHPFAPEGPNGHLLALCYSVNWDHTLTLSLLYFLHHPHENLHYFVCWPALCSEDILNLNFSSLPPDTLSPSVLD